MKQLSRKKTILLLTFLVMVWGVNWPLSKMALSYSPPILFAGIRTVLGGLILLLFAIPRYKKLHFKETWHYYLLSAFLNIILFYGLQTIGLGYAPAGLFSAIVFIEPVLLGIFCWLWLGEQMYGLKIFGLILGFIGILIISAGGFTGDISPIGIFLALGSALAWGLGTVFIKKIGNRVDSIWMVTVQLIMGGFFLMLGGSSLENWSVIKWEVPFIMNLLFISTFVIAFGWLAFFILVGSGEASKVGSFTFLIPLIAIMFSSFLLKEPITLNLIIGLLFVVTSILFVNIKRKSNKNHTLKSVKNDF
ncbi:DMT family transporter [Niallia nealsonii]|uniref:EamA/RhaT family transporter n=1 Tax=Niallia nealsonii TaxID=115979 RepID=A0A2N0Z0G0_9BACI|nr:DMT family transporter [Niallia nealsonii]PKG22993.1 EamA/RhaT family transporter [Niallia nealsonii]